MVCLVHCDDYVLSVSDVHKVLVMYSVGDVFGGYLGPVHEGLADLADLEHGGGLDVVPGGKGKLKNPDQQITIPSQRLEYQ